MGSFGTLTLPGLQVLDANGAAVFSRTNVSVPSTGHQTFTGPWTSTTLTIVVNTTGLGGDSDNVALDNISFTESGGSAGGGGGSQTPAIEVVARGARLRLVAAGQVRMRTITARDGNRSADRFVCLEFERAVHASGFVPTVHLGAGPVARDDVPLFADGGRPAGRGRLIPCSSALRRSRR